MQSRVFEASIHLLQERGYEAISFATIAERAGVHETSLYRRWKTKENLVIDAISSQVAQDIPIPDSGTFRSDLIQLLQFLRTFLQSTAGQAIIEMAVVSRHMSSHNSFLKDYWRRRSALLRPLFDRAIARGELSPHTDLQLFFEMLIGVLYIRVFAFGEPLDETLPAQIVDLLLSGVFIDKPAR
ncbi:MAG TPA: TetR/AcrR family transcriptional regulator [Ktedonosporobacter sp.]|nr:TetR/AcrR family transcriptional regulator [Ktedonosporobacter sp.]